MVVLPISAFVFLFSFDPLEIEVVRVLIVFEVEVLNVIFSRSQEICITFTFIGLFVQGVILVLVQILVLGVVEVFDFLQVDYGLHVRILLLLVLLTNRFLPLRYVRLAALVRVLFV